MAIFTPSELDSEEEMACLIKVQSVELPKILNKAIFNCLTGVQGIYTKFHPKFLLTTPADSSVIYYLVLASFCSSIV